jgi:hypothetical protein
MTQAILDDGVKGLPWKEGIIGRTEIFMEKRFKFHPMWAKALGTILTTASLGNVDRYTFNDQFGACYANPFFIYIGRSGLAIKTPPIKMIKRMLYDYNKQLLCPTSFNPDSFAEWVEGTDGETGGKKKRKVVPPHPINVCIADEASRILGEIKAHSYQENLPTYLSKLWDGEIEGKYTRGYQSEGNLSVFFSMLAATSKDFYRLLDRAFFVQGLGNRVLWVVEDRFTPPHLDSETFFFGSSRDKEFDELAGFVVEGLRRVDRCVSVMMHPKGGKVWCDYTNDYFDKISKMTDDSEAEYCSKVPLNILKLSINYAASRLNKDAMGMIFIAEEDIKMAIQDTKEYFKMWKIAMQQWSDYQGGDKNEIRLKTVRYDTMLFVRYAIDNKGIICASEVQARGNYPDRSKISEVLSAAETVGYLERLNRPWNQDNLTATEFAHYKKICNGNVPVVWRVTQLGEEKCKV